MPVRSLPITSVFCVLVAVFVTGDVILIHVRRAPGNRIHTLIVAALIVASVWVLLRTLLRAIRAEFADVRADIAFLRAEIADNRPTEPLPRVVIRGTAVVGTVGSPPLPIDPDVISIAERLHSRVNGSDDH